MVEVLFVSQKPTSIYSHGMGLHDNFQVPGLTCFLFQPMHSAALEVIVQARVLPQEVQVYTLIPNSNNSHGLSVPSTLQSERDTCLFCADDLGIVPPVNHECPFQKRTNLPYLMQDRVRF